jgi:anti-sigma B factor antagonist
MAAFTERVRDGGVRVVEVSGDFDLEVTEEFLEFARGAAEDCTALEVDLEQVSFIDSSGLSALLRLRAEVDGRGIPLRLLNLRPAVRRVFAITGLLDVFGVPEKDPE